jgi:hypothetical protein
MNGGFKAPTIAAALVWSAVPAAQAQVANCVQQFYDASYNNWLAFRNGCSQAIYVAIVRGDGRGSVGALDIGPGRHQSTGLSAREVSEMGNVRFAVCPKGAIPISGSTRKYWRNPDDQYVCKNQ